MKLKETRLKLKSMFRNKYFEIFKPNKTVHVPYLKIHKFNAKNRNLAILCGKIVPLLTPNLRFLHSPSFKL